MSEVVAASESSTLFRPPAEHWEGLSRKYLAVKLISIFIWWPILIALAAGTAWVFSSGWSGREPLVWGVIGGGVALLAWRAIRAPFAFRRWGYAERGEDVYITSGLMVRTLTCVPYGRMQVVEVQSGPIERLFGIATVRMVTASSSGAIAIPGLERAAAEAVRDRFINRGEHLRAGI